MSNKRPRGGWKARPKNASLLQPQNACACDSDTDEDEDTRSSQTSKRRRSAYKLADNVCDIPLALPSPPMQPPSPPKDSCDLDDWEDLKDLFARAVDTYERDDILEALPFLRGVIHECHRFLRYYADPSVLFTEQPTRHHSRSPDTLTPPEERLRRDWGHDRTGSRPSSRGSSSSSATQSRCAGRLRLPPVPCSSPLPSKDLPTAFHTIYGFSLFLFGNIIAHDPHLALAGEPDVGSIYWLAALDVFEAGENLPSKTDGRAGGEDWRMAIAWGRTLISLADEKACGRAIPVEPRCPRESPFSITARAPMTRRAPFAEASANDMLVLATDQLSRGILHMPHSRGVPQGFRWSRAKELFTIASEVLAVAEKLVSPVQRRYWAQWSDGIYDQMRFDPAIDMWRRSVTSARGRCWLIIGASRAEDLEVALAVGHAHMLDTEEAEEARDGLRQAVSFLESATGSPGSGTPCIVQPGSHELHSLLAEALLTLANLTRDEASREALYVRAQMDRGDQVVLAPTDERMEECE